MRVLVMGASGMLGSATYRTFAESEEFEVVGTVRSAAAANAISKCSGGQFMVGVNAESADSLARCFAEVRPSLVINCIGIIKQLPSAKDPLHAIPINSLLPHRLQALSAACNARLIHVSTDCVFSGARGCYREDDVPDAVDLYGRSKLLGEVDAENAITLRTSIIGEEAGGGAIGLVGWFLAQTSPVGGFRRAIFSGLPTITLARVMRDVLVPRDDLKGLFHVGARAIDKFELLSIVKAQYGKDIEILPDDTTVIDRSLNSDRFAAATGYVAPDWPELIKEMHSISAHWR